MRNRFNSNLFTCKMQIVIKTPYILYCYSLYVIFYFLFSFFFSLSEGEAFAQQANIFNLLCMLPFVVQFIVNKNVF